MAPVRAVTVDRTRLYLGVLRDAVMFKSGEIGGGRPVYAEPMVGLGAYEGLRWWDGPLTATDLVRDEGAPSGKWANKQSTKDGANVTFGDTVTLVAKVKDTVPIKEVRFTAYYEGWPRKNAAARLDGFSEHKTWRILAVCRPPGVGGEPAKTKKCKWDGTDTECHRHLRLGPNGAGQREGHPVAAAHDGGHQ